MLSQSHHIRHGCCISIYFHISSCIRMLSHSHHICQGYCRPCCTGRQKQQPRTGALSSQSRAYYIFHACDLQPPNSNLKHACEQKYILAETLVRSPRFFFSPLSIKSFSWIKVSEKHSFNFEKRSAGSDQCPENQNVAISRP